MSEPAHVPVLAERVAFWLVTDPAGVYWDATVGAAGHARRITEQLTEGGKLFGSDRDPNALRLASAALTTASVTLVRARFSELGETWRQLEVRRLDGILFDFGIGSFQIEDAERGISFEQDGPLDMRMDPDARPLSDWLNRATDREIEQAIRHLGEEPRARAIAREIVRRRPLGSTQDLRAAILAATRSPHAIRTLARVFQAFRIKVNAELEEIRAGLEATHEVLAPGGRLVAISYHSLEDRIVKEFFRRESRDCICPPDAPICACDHRAWLRTLTRKPEVPDPGEVAVNRRARSAKLRVAERIE
jgi:16S rRNA (cytosine1402-N4)-methyltransferase